MKLFKFALIALLALAAPSAALAEGHRGEKTISLLAGYAHYNRSGMAGVEFTYRFSEHFRLAPGVDYVFRHNGMDALQITLDCHIPFSLPHRMEIYPLVGVNFTGWNNHLKAIGGDVTTRVNRFGLNVGAGWGICLGERLCLGVAIDYLAIKDFDGFETWAKIGYRF